MSETEKPKENTIQDLQRKLKDFAAASPEIQKTQLADLIQFIQVNATQKVIDRLVSQEFQTKLQTAINSTLATLLDFDGKEVNPWTNCATIVALDEQGNIKGAISIPPKDMTDYGGSYNFFTPALCKALVSMHLKKADRKGGIADNRRYLREITVEVFKYHTGAIDEPITLPGSDTGIYLGASGCEANSDVVSTVLDGATPTHWTQAGVFDEAFAQITSVYLSEPVKSIQRMNAPRPIERLIAGN